MVNSQETTGGRWKPSLPRNEILEDVIQRTHGFVAAKVPTFYSRNEAGGVERATSAPRAWGSAKAGATQKGKGRGSKGGARGGGGRGRGSRVGGGRGGDGTVAASGTKETATRAASARSGTDGNVDGVGRRLWRPGPSVRKASVAAGDTVDATQAVGRSTSSPRRIWTRGVATKKEQEQRAGQDDKAEESVEDTVPGHVVTSHGLAASGTAVQPPRRHWTGTSGSTDSADGQDSLMSEGRVHTSRKEVEGDQDGQAKELKEGEEDSYLDGEEGVHDEESLHQDKSLEEVVGDRDSDDERTKRPAERGEESVEDKRQDEEKGNDEDETNVDETEIAEQGGGSRDEKDEGERDTEEIEYRVEVKKHSDAKELLDGIDAELLEEDSDKFKGNLKEVEKEEEEDVEDKKGKKDKQKGEETEEEEEHEQKHQEKKEQSEEKEKMSVEVKDEEKDELEDDEAEEEIKEDVEEERKVQKEDEEKKEEEEDKKEHSEANVKTTIKVEDEEKGELEHDEAEEEKEEDVEVERNDQKEDKEKEEEEEKKEQSEENVQTTVEVEDELKEELEHDEAEDENKEDVEMREDQKEDEEKRAEEEEEEEEEREDDAQENPGRLSDRPRQMGSKSQTSFPSPACGVSQVPLLPAPQSAPPSAASLEAPWSFMRGAARSSPPTPAFPLSTHAIPTAAALQVQGPLSLPTPLACQQPYASLAPPPGQWTVAAPPLLSTKTSLSFPPPPVLLGSASLDCTQVRKFAPPEWEPWMLHCASYAEYLTHGPGSGATLGSASAGPNPCQPNGGTAKERLEALWAHHCKVWT
eukprot:TRINITY_DN2722_c0_g1_i3.p1 TRINITY_DN2722_c0_g1~~TRINITY_DN2722_c0_g1_i3.p1  ORF type:complete len:808 (-),score=250.57 TRINITY_DN2722_c0_g1_i3:114-2537(-)